MLHTLDCLRFSHFIETKTVDWTFKKLFVDIVCLPLRKSCLFVLQITVCIVSYRIQWFIVLSLMRYFVLSFCRSRCWIASLTRDSRSSLLMVFAFKEKLCWWKSTLARKTYCFKWCFANQTWHLLCNKCFMTRFLPWAVLAISHDRNIGVYRLYSCL